MVIQYNQKLLEKSLVVEVIESDMTLLKYAKEWLKIYKANIEASTKEMYLNIINVHLKPFDCLCSPENITRRHYHSFINAIPGTRTKQQACMTYKQLAKSLVRDKILTTENFDDIFEDSIKIKYIPEEKRALTEAEKKATFLAELKPFDKNFLLLLYGLGLRRGETLALEKGDIDIDNQRVRINKALGYVGNNPYLKEPKTENGKRTVPIPNAILNTLKDYLETLKGDYLFPSREGNYFTKSSYRKMWDRIIKKMQEVSDEEISGLTAHIFRHNYCANLCYHIPDISIKQIAALLGDTDKMVLEVYNHIIAEKEKPLEVVEKALAIKL